MPKQLFQWLAIIVFVSFAAGCASSGSAGGGVTSRAYVADKERVDQTMEGGNFGYLAGTPQAADRSNFKKTRKVYVMEFTKEPPEESDTTAPVAAASSSYTPPEPQEARMAEPQGRTIELPRFDDEPAPSTGSASFEEQAAPSGGGQAYTVQKDDTLQKISKKFYGTYSKWPQIYEANKTVIKNPNRIKSGIVLQIP